jgi:ribosomal protein S18 acetylase RimI-like enzyme
LEESVAVIRAHLTGMLEALGSLPGATFAADGGVARSGTPIRWPFFNGVLPGADADLDVVAEALATTPRPFFFWELEDTPPAALRLAREAGLRPLFGREPWMDARIADLPDVELPDGLTLEDGRGGRAWAEVMGAVYGFPPAAVEAWATPGETFPWSTWMARLHGEPVATSAVVTCGGVAGLYGVGTAPSARRRGIGRVLTVTPLRASGAEVAGLFASPDGEPLYRGLGFQTTGWLTRHIAE